MLTRTGYRRKKVEERREEIQEPLASFDYSTLAKILWEELSEAFPNFDLLQEICQFPIVLHQEKSDGSIALHVACYNSNCLKSERIINYLINLFPESVKYRNKYGLMPLHKAVTVTTVSQLDVVKSLIDRDLTTLSMKTNDGHTPLHLAISVPKVPCLELIDYLIMLNTKLLLIPDLFGHLPLHKAVSRSKVDPLIVEHLVENCFESAGLKDLKGFLPIHWVCSKDDPNIEIAIYLGEHYPDGLLEYDNEGNTPLMKFLKNPNRNREVEQTLLELTEYCRVEVAEKRSRSIYTASSVPRSPASSTFSSPSSRTSSRKTYRTSSRR